MKLFSCSLLFAIVSSAQGQSKQLVDFFLPMEPRGPLISEGTWGEKSVLPRDVKNGLEDADLSDWCYWDGKIVKDDEGIFHMYASRWDQKLHHGPGWNKGSRGMHAVSDHLLGPYVDQGMTWPEWKGGFGHNVIGLRMSDGRYAMISSEVTPGDVFVSDSPSGPWSYHGALQIEHNGFYRGLARYDELDDGAVRAGTVGHMANVMIITRPDGRYMIIARHCAPMISEDGILGPYKIMADKAWRGVAGIPQFKMEDPTVWYSDQLYHIVVNHYNEDVTYHLTSEDGIHNWKSRGLAFRHDKKIFRYPDGTVNDWFTVQRPTVYTEGDTVKCFNFSVIDVHKGQDDGDDHNASKIVIVPFDGEAFGKEMRATIDREHQLADATPPPSPWVSNSIGTGSGKAGFEAEFNTLRVKAAGGGFGVTGDDCHFVSQNMSGDISAKVLVMAQDIEQGKPEAGLMIRSSLDADAPFLAATISHGGLFSLKMRMKKGEASSLVSSSKLRAPYWLRLEKRGDVVSCFTSPNNHFNWTKVGEETVPFGDTFQVGMVAASTEARKTALSRFKDVDVHSWGSPKEEGVISHSFPDFIPSSGKITFEVEYETHQTMDVLVELQNVKTTMKFKALRKRLDKKGVMELTYDVGEALPSGEMYWFVLKTLPMHGHENTAMQSTFKKVFVK